MFDFTKNKYGDFSYQTKKYLLAKFLKEGRADDLKKELFVAKKLLVKYPNGKFWLNYDLSFKLNSLAFFLTPEGSQLISSAFKEFSLEIKTNSPIFLLGEKIEVKKVAFQPKNIRDFLKT